MTTTTPMMVQYHAIKAKHKDAILFFRLGDFYEMFEDDAKVASAALSLTLTGRGKDDNRIPMCGIPHHASENYVAKLVKQGYKVAICEQVEEAGLSKGPTKRDVVRVVTPGTAQLDPVLDATDSNYLAAICTLKGGYGIAYVDLSTGEFKCDSFLSEQQACNEIARIQAKEVLVDDALSLQLPGVSQSPFFAYTANQAEAAIKDHFHIQQVSVFDIQEHAAAFPAVVAILQYLDYTQKGAFGHIQTIQPANTHAYCRYDHGVIEHLDIFSKKGLFSFLNHTHTPLGARQLRQWLRYPLIDAAAIKERQQKVQVFINNPESLEACNATLEPIPDIERLVSKVCAQFNNPKDIQQLSVALNQLANVVGLVQQLGPMFQHEAQILMDVVSEPVSLYSLRDTLQAALKDDVPVHTREGGIFKPGYSKELDDLCQSFKDIREWIQQLEPRCREEFGIKNLKVGFNKVFGYYIEIPNSQKDKVPDHFIRKQTLSNAERYITPILKEKETILLNAQTQQTQIEQRLFQELIRAIMPYVGQCQTYAACVAGLDALQSLARVAIKHHFTCPTVTQNGGTELSLKGVWHPMVAQQQKTPFIRNNVDLSQAHPFMLITGPNMAGKSTVMRSVALCVILGQMGSMVPADAADFDIVESLYTRIGANDKLSEGQSTFMVEMVETATICHNANVNSLILLDEIGRGTSTFDGVSIAAAITEYMVTDIGARVLFATHYHELTALADVHTKIINASMQIKEADGNLVFSYKLVQGAAEKSYGVTVAKMAGLPVSITNKAQEWLDTFEQKAASGEIVQLRLF